MDQSINEFFCTLMIKILSDLSDVIQLCLSYTVVLKLKLKLPESWI